MSDVRCLPLRDEHVPAALAMCRSSILHQPNSPYNEAQRAAWASFDPEAWAKRLRNQRSWGAWHRDRLVGVASVESQGPNMVWLDLLYVCPSWQRQGMGSAMLDALERPFAPGTTIQLDASLSLVPMLTRRGYYVLEQRNPSLRGQNLLCARMEKVLP